MGNPFEVSWWERFWDYIKEGVSGGFPVNPFAFFYKGQCLIFGGIVDFFSKGTGTRFLCPGELDDALYNINFLEQHPDKEKDFMAINNAAAGLYKAVFTMLQSYVSRYGANECYVSGVQTDLLDLADVMRPENPARGFFGAERDFGQFFKGRKHEPNLLTRIKNYIFGGKTKHVVWVNGQKYEVKRKHKNLFERIYEGITGGDHHRNVFREFVHWFRRGKFVRRYLKLLDYIVEGTKKTADGKEEDEKKELAKTQYKKLQKYVREHLNEALDKKYGGNRYYYRKLGLMLNRLAWRHKDKWGEDLQDDYGGMVPKISQEPLPIVKNQKYTFLNGQWYLVTEWMTNYDLEADALLRYYDLKATDQEPWRRGKKIDKKTGKEKNYLNLNQFIHSGDFSYTLDQLGRVVKIEPIEKTRFERDKENVVTSYQTFHA